MTWELVRNPEACIRPDLNQNVHFKKISVIHMHIQV